MTPSHIYVKCRGQKTTTMKKLTLIFAMALIALGVAAQNSSRGSIAELTRNANAGDKIAQFDLAFIYMEGDGVKADVQKAMDWFALSAEPNYWPAYENAKECWLSILEKRGESFGWTDNDWARFEKMYADKGYGWAQHLYGYYLESRSPEDGGPDLKGALDLYTKAADKDDIIAAFRLGEAYYSGLPLAGGKKNHALAAKYFNKVLDIKLEEDVERKDLRSVAAKRLSTLYRFGRGVAENTRKANELMTLAADFGNAEVKDLLKKLNIPYSEK